FDRWWKDARRRQPDLLTFTPEMLTNAATAGQVRAEDYPDEVHLSHGLTLPLSYAFAPGTAEDGVTVDVPLAVLDGVAATTPGEPLLPALERELRRATAVTIPPDAWAPEQVPDHLRATFRVLDDHHRPVATGKDLAALKAQVAPRARASLARAA